MDAMRCLRDAYPEPGLGARACVMMRPHRRPRMVQHPRQRPRLLDHELLQQPVRKQDQGGEDNTALLEALLEAADAAVALQPGDARLLLERGSIQHAMGRTDAAVLDAERAVEACPTLLLSSLTLVHALASSGRVGAALAHAEKAANDHPGDPYALAALGGAELAAGRPHDAVMHTRAALRDLPDNAWLRDTHIAAMAAVEDAEGREKQPERECKEEPGEREGAAGMAALCASPPCAEAAVGDLAVACVLQPDNPVWRAGLGAALLMTGCTSRAWALWHVRTARNMCVGRNAALRAVVTDVLEALGVDLARHEDPSSWFES